MAVTLQKIAESKNGLVRYQAGRQRVDGKVYIDSKCFEGPAPDTLTIEAEGFKEAAPAKARSKKEATDAAATGDVASTSGVDGSQSDAPAAE